MKYRHTQHASATIKVRSLAPSQPCGPGADCHHSADCPDHYCPGHPGAPHDAAAEPDLIFGAAAVTMCVFAWLLAALGFTLAAVL